MRLSVRDHEGRAQLQLIDGPNVIGVAMMTWDAYRGIARTLLRQHMEFLGVEVNACLSKLLWSEANALKTDPANAIKLLEEFGWNAEKIQAFASEIARHVTNELINKIPA